MFPLSNLKDVFANIRESIKAADLSLQERDTIREKVIKTGRDIVRKSGHIITSLHSGRYDEAQIYLTEMQKTYELILSVTSNYPEIRHSGLFYNIVSEYVEAVLFYNLLTNGRLPAIKELKVEPVPYIQGLLDLVGELKRRILDLLRADKFEDAVSLFKVTEAIYENVKTLDYPDPILPGVKRKTDVARSVVESLRTLLTDVESRRRLIKSLRKCERS